VLIYTRPFLKYISICKTISTVIFMHYLIINILLLVIYSGVIMFLRVYNVLIILLILLFKIITWLFEIWKTCWLNVLHWQSMKIFLKFLVFWCIILFIVKVIMVPILILVLYIVLIGLIILIVIHLIIKLILKWVWIIFDLLLRMNIALENYLWVILILIFNLKLFILEVLVLSIL